jgi:hypothetical protein
MFSPAGANSFLRKVNNEGKVRQPTRSLVLGQAKIMGYEDLEEARAKRAVKDTAKAKGKANVVGNATTDCPRL